MAERQGFSWNPDTHGEGTHSFSSGTRSHDHTGTPNYLIEVRCVRQSRNYIFKHLTNHQGIFTPCYLIVPVNHLRKYTMVLPHMLIHKDFAEPLKHCMQCNEIMTRIKPVNECGDCIETFSNTDEMNLNQGWRIAVFRQNREE